ncbi:hypothetical protein TSUD_59930 [Trifolium subterraneum]|uniref:TF-B3 domain-containing protein n=1 Tax=Trifolium subterraneum TaxID=3900 RepID=A0A2Z6P8T4_TRISU|nr:hypothetical protein TSUD_59930 [Trifolium subterraneum]
MVSYVNLLAEVPLGGFTSAYFHKQKYCQVDPEFAAEFGSDIGCDWKFVGANDKIHKATFNKDPVHPWLMDGWSELSSAFGFSGDCLVSFVYVGDDTFCLVLDELWNAEVQLPAYHSRSLYGPYNANFCVRLTEDVVNRPYLNIFCDFEDHVIGERVGRIAACCDNGSVTYFDVSSTVFPFKMTAIGLGWKNFCEANNFCIGDALCFKFSAVTSSNVAYVFKIEE